MLEHEKKALTAKAKGISSFPQNPNKKEKLFYIIFGVYGVRYSRRPPIRSSGFAASPIHRF